MIVFQATPRPRVRAGPASRTGPHAAARRRRWSVPRDDPLEAAWLAARLTLSRALVLEDGRLPGLLSATDVQRILDAQQRGASRPPLRHVAA